MKSLKGTQTVTINVEGLDDEGDTSEWIATQIANAVDNILAEVEVSSLSINVEVSEKHEN
jgi:hypothetical protein